MNILANVSFDDKATLVMGIAFDQACNSLRHLAYADKVRDLIAKHDGVGIDVPRPQCDSSGARGSSQVLFTPHGHN